MSSDEDGLATIPVAALAALHRVYAIWWQQVGVLDPGEPFNARHSQVSHADLDALKDACAAVEPHEPVITAALASIPAVSPAERVRRECAEELRMLPWRVRAAIRAGDDPVALLIDPLIAEWTANQPDRDTGGDGGGGHHVRPVDSPCVRMVSRRSRSRHPHDFVHPAFRLLPGTSCSFPQSHLHSHSRAPWRFLLRVVRTRSRPNRRPVRSPATRVGIYGPSTALWSSTPDRRCGSTTVRTWANPCCS